MTDGRAVVEAWAREDIGKTDYSLDEALWLDVGLTAATDLARRIDALVAAREAATRRAERERTDAMEDALEAAEFALDLADDAFPVEADVAALESGGARHIGASFTPRAIRAIRDALALVSRVIEATPAQPAAILTAQPTAPPRGEGDE